MPRISHGQNSSTNTGSTYSITPLAMIGIDPTTQTSNIGAA